MASVMKIGVLKELKMPLDERAPLSPVQCKEIIATYPSIQVVVQKSSIRRFKDSEYEQYGIETVDSVNDCDILLGVKEVPVERLIPNKTYFFFSHATTNKHPQNCRLLKALLDKKITMIDYECLTSKLGCRLIICEYFGRDFISKVLPHLVNGDREEVLAKATICRNGELTSSYEYLRDYVNKEITVMRV